MSIANSMYVYFRFLSVSVRSQMQYKVSFIMLTVGHLVVTASEFVAVLVLFDRFDSIQGYCWRRWSWHSYRK